jgi:hypothetical protein
MRVGVFEVVTKAALNAYKPIILPGNQNLKWARQKWNQDNAEEHDLEGVYIVFDKRILSSLALEYRVLNKYRSGFSGRSSPFGTLSKVSRFAVMDFTCRNRHRLVLGCQYIQWKGTTFTCKSPRCSSSLVLYRVFISTVRMFRLTPAYHERELIPTPRCFSWPQASFSSFPVTGVPTGPFYRKCIKFFHPVSAEASLATKNTLASIAMVKRLTSSISADIDWY